MNDSERSWPKLQEQARQHARDEQWGLFCNALFDIGMALARDGKMRQAVRTLAGAIYISLNGPNNLPYPVDDDLVKRLGIRRWEPEFGTPITSYVLDFYDFAGELDIDLDGLKEVFLDTAEQYHKRLATPIQPAAAWRIVAQAVVNLGDE